LHAAEGRSVPELEQPSFYDLLGVSRRARKEDIENACVHLWYRYQCMRGTPLWDAIAERIDLMRVTLLFPDTRATYDKLLAEREAARLQERLDHSTPFSDLLEQHQQAYQKYGTSGNALGHSTVSALHGKTTSPLRKLGYANAGSTSFMFYKLVELIAPENWSDIQAICLIVLAFGIATSVLSFVIARFMVRAMARADVASAKAMLKSDPLMNAHRETKNA